MSYVVILMPSALAELDEAYRWLSAESPESAPVWYNGLLDALYSLEQFPARCPIAAESLDIREPTRQLLYGDRRHAYKVLYVIREEKILVLHIRHGARGRGE